MTTPLRWLLLALLVTIAPLARAASEPKFETLGNDTYRVTVTASHKFTRNTGKLKNLATDAARAFCQEKGKHLQVLDTDEAKSMYFVGKMPTATLTFKAVDEAELQQPAAAVSHRAAPVTNQTLYDDLVRLDELRKKGILTDEEFASEKKKVLDRSK